MYQGLQSSKRDNQLKTWILIVLLPAFLGAGVFVVFYFLNTKNGNSGTQALNLALSDTGEILTLLVPILILWLLISFFFQKSSMFSFSAAKEKYCSKERFKIIRRTSSKSASIRAADCGAEKR